jgi:hypothetical protein
MIAVGLRSSVADRNVGKCKATGVVEDNEDYCVTIAVVGIGVEMT